MPGGELSPQEAARTVRLVLAGRRESYALLVDAFQDRVRAALAAGCRSAEEVEEAAHAAFVEAYRRLADFDPARGAFLSWLLAIARSALLIELRRRRAAGERAAEYLERAARAAPAEPAAHLAAGARAALEGCLAELSPGERRLVESRYRLGWPSSKLAVVLRKSPGAVRMALQRLRERLRRCIERRLSGGAEASP